MVEFGYQYIHFYFSEKWDPIYSFCDYFFEYIGLWVCDDFGVADSLDKVGPWFENLSELVSRLGGGLNRTCREPSARSSANSGRRARGSLHVQTRYKHQAMLWVQNA